MRMFIQLLCLLSISSVTVHAFFGGQKIKTLKSLVVTDAEYPVLPQNVVNQLVDLTTTSLLQPYLLGVILFILPIPGGFGQFGMNSIENKDKEKDGKAISAALQGGFSKLLALTNPGAISVPKGYNRFPNDNGIETLQHFLRSNSFYATALIPDGSGYKISSSDKSNRFSKYLAVMDPALDRVNAKFDSQMRLIDIRYEGGKKALKDEEANIAAAKLTWNLSYVAEIFHISLHVFHYMMTVGLMYATLEDKVLQSWAKIYAYNLDSSIDGVATELVKKDGLLIKAPAKTDLDKMLTLMRSTVSEFGNLKSSEDFKKWLFPPALLTKLQKDGHMTEFLRHESFVKDYAAELSDALKDADVVSFSKADDRLKFFLSSIGRSKSQPLCKVSNIKTWIELMAVTGLFHGQTASWSRLSFSNTFYRYVNANPKYDKPESKFAGLAAVTMNIAQKDQYVFKNKNKGPTSVIKVISKYDKLTCDIKKNYLEKSKKEEYFNEYGWIYADFYSDHFDGRSTGITYY